MVNPTQDDVHFRSTGITALCRAFSIGKRLMLNPDPAAVTCPKCKRLLAERNKVKPKRMREYRT